MISRKIPSKIDQIRIRTKRTVAGTRLVVPGYRMLRKGALFEPSPETGGCSRAMKYRDHHNKRWLDSEMDVVFVKNFKPGFVNRLTAEGKMVRVSQDALQGGADIAPKPVSQSRLALIIPFYRVLKFKTRFPVKDYFAAHFLFLSLSGNSAQICSQGMPVSGLRHTRSARRSNSSICSGDKLSSKSPNSSRIWPVTSRRSFSGNRRICSKISVALMAPIYYSVSRAQAAILPCQRMKGLCPQITQINADKEPPFSICVNLRPSAGNSGFNPQSAIRNSHDPARNS